ncbi:MAG: 16S rRNA (guanine(527)-N(7))-methyltransferase RsmG [Pseudochelatococcus sp.]|jgi:16S rRNA (guanine527-N7)-methyltransferase|uniref:16S rRNA (guanine(527)-N(7))-methyltransferase RsmG n=1 Tax=Pseudochelatococcus sp. TaxID=2020869 RepID=UPI003D904A80
MNAKLESPHVDRGKAEALAPFFVSRETSDRLTILVHELRRWQTIKNLVGPGTLDDIWTRHVADSLQLFRCAPETRNWLDLGSGAGFPGVVLGILLREHGEGQIDLVESNGRKCAFLRHAIRATGASAKVHQGRIADILPMMKAGQIEVVTARALAPLHDLLSMAKDLLRSGATGVFPKGQDWEAELTEARKYWRITVDVQPSLIDSRGRILVVRELQEVDGDHGRR